MLARVMASEIAFYTIHFSFLGIGLKVVVIESLGSGEEQIFFVAALISPSFLHLGKTLQSFHFHVSLPEGVGDE